MKPYIHSKNSVKKYGGKTQDYQKLHDWMDSSKAHFPDSRHRCLFHHSYGIYIGEQLFGTTITNSDGKVISVRDILEDHVIEDLGFIATVQDYLEHLPFVDWFSRLNSEETKAEIKTEKKKKDSSKTKIVTNEDIDKANENKVAFEEAKKVLDELSEETSKTEKKSLPHTPPNVDPLDIVVDGAGKGYRDFINNNRRID